jgi:hypothetical protein
VQVALGVLGTVLHLVIDDSAAPPISVPQ